MEDCYNHVELCGGVLTAPEPSHTNHGESFYRFLLSVPRLSGLNDELPVLVRESLLPEDLSPGDTVTLLGQLRSFNNRSGIGRRLVLSIFARSLVKSPGAEIKNHIRLCGAVCKPPVLRSTPLGREICDLTLAVNRRYGRADYLPLIAWGTVARQTSILAVGARLTVEGRIQSRTYTKNLETGPQERVAYEVSVMRPAELSEFVE